MNTSDTLADSYIHLTEVLGYFTHYKTDYKTRREALTIGSRVDALCQENWREGKYKLKKSERPEVVNCMQAWERWKNDHVGDYASIHVMQEPQYFDDWKIQGTLDIRTHDSIIDIKTSKEIYSNYWLQVAGYNRYYRLPHLKILCLDKNTSEYLYQESPYSQEYLEEVLKGVLSYYFYLTKGKESL